MKTAYISLGCPKNVADLECILGSLGPDIEICSSPDKASSVIINTCAFIDDAKQEAIDTILEACLIKNENPDFKIFVTGCMPQRFKEELLQEIPEIDAIFTSTDPFETIDELKKHFSTLSDRNRYSLTPPHYAYLKIAEGCNNRCSYCAIPTFKGDYKSRPKEDILKEAIQLADSGVKELLLVSQDITYYGMDQNKTDALKELLISLESISGIKWVRLLYTHPAHWTDDLIDVVAGSSKIVPYIDLPLQHISDKILTKMGRKVTSQQIRELTTKLRAKIPNLALRTSFIVGFPGETESDFQKLVEFVKTEKFERLGVFTYSQEEGTAAFNWQDNIPENIKISRQKQIMETQAALAELNNQQLIGSTLEILIDQNEKENNISLGRTQWDAPEIDNSVIVNGLLKPGHFYKCKIEDVTPYDLFAVNMTEI